MTNRAFPVLWLAFSLAGIGAAVAAADDIRREEVRFPEGQSGTTVEGSLTGREIVDYTLRARAGQHMTVELETDNASNYFNVMAPGETEVAFFIGSIEGNRFEGDLPEDGEYTLRVYLYRNAARRGETADYTLEIAIPGPDSATDGG